VLVLQQSYWATALILTVKDEHVRTPTVEVLDMKDTLSRRSNKTYPDLLVWGQALLKLNYLRGYSLEHPFGGIALHPPNPLAAQPVKGEEAASPETASCIRKETSRQPIRKPSNGTIKS
jgi:hypothetical protein